MKKEKESVFRVGDRVWHPIYGWGKVVENKYVELSVYFNDYQGGYGECYSDDTRKLLSFTEYELNANQVRPFEDGDIVFYDEDCAGYNAEVIAIWNDNETFHLSYNLFRDAIYISPTILKRGGIIATEAQKQHLFDRLAKEDKRWNPETKKLEDIEVAFEDGDIVHNVEEHFVFIYKKRDVRAFVYHYYAVDTRSSFSDFDSFFSSKNTFVKATAEQKQILFDRLKREGKKWNEETKQLEDLNEPKVGDDVIMWNKGSEMNATIDKLDLIKNNGYYGIANVTNRAILWDGTKEQFDNIRNSK